MIAPRKNTGIEMPVSETTVSARSSQPPAMHRREQAEQDSHDQPDDARAERQGDRGRQVGDDFLLDVGLLRIGDDAAVEHLFHRPQILDVDRLIEAPLHAHVLHLLGSRQAPSHAQGGVATGDRLEDQEGEHRDREQDRRQRGEAARKEADQPRLPRHRR